MIRGVWARLRNLLTTTPTTPTPAPDQARVEATTAAIMAVDEIISYIDAMGQGYCRLHRDSATPTRDVIDHLADVRNVATRNRANLLRMAGGDRG